RVDCRERAHHVAVARDRGRRADAAFQIDRGGAHPGPDAAELEILAGGRRRGIAEIAERREPAPILVAAPEQVEEHGSGHDRHARRTDRGPTAPLPPPSLTAAGRL